MSDESRIQQLFEEILESGRAPEEVCAQFPQLLWQVLERVRQCEAVEAEIDALFPRSGEGGRSRQVISADDPLPLIPGYHVEAVQGRGGVGVVYMARHLKLNRTVALKMLLAGHYAGPHERARFTREAEAIAALRHPNIVQVFDAGEFESQPFFTMEFVEGGSLAEKLANVPQPVRVAAAMADTLAKAVHSAHQSGIVHRDLKPANILLTLDGTPKVSDFGLARYFESDPGITSSGSRLGTPCYMSPEQALGKAAAVGPLADVYALGAILYEMLTGRPPFRGESSSDTERQVIMQEPVPPSRLNPKVPRDLETICLKCLAKDAKRRYATAAALAEDLGRFERGEPVAARRAGHVDRLSKWVRRHPALAMLLVTGVMLMVILVSIASWLVADRAATVRAIETDLREAAAAQQRSAWPEATAALERGKARLGKWGFAELRRRLEESSNNISLVKRLDSVRFWRIKRQKADGDYLAVFAEAGMGNLVDDPNGVAPRITASPIRAEWLTALDDWAIGTSDPQRRAALLKIARAADPDPSGWRNHLRDPNTWKNEAVLGELADIVRIDEQPVHLLVALGTSLKREDRAPFLRRVQAAYPGDFYANLILALSLADIQEHQDALAFFQSAVAIRPNSGGAHYHLGWGLHVAGHNDEAVKQFERAIRLNPTDAWAHSMLGVALGELGQLDAAIERQHQALRIDPLYVPARNYLTMSLLEKGRYDEALAECQRALELDPRNAWAFGNAGIALAALGRRDQAIESFRKAIEIDGGDASTHSNLAAALVDVGQDDEAMEHLRLALQLDAKHSKAHARMANVLMRRGQRDEAIVHYQQALQTDPQDGLTHLNLAMAMEGRGDLGDAVHHYRQAVELHVKDPRAVIKLAALLTALGNGEEARETWRHALDENPASHDAWHGYAELCLYLGDTAEYRQARLDLLSRFGDSTDPLIAERTARSCLLLPLTDDELKRVAALADRAVAAKGIQTGWSRAFVAGMLAYRQGDLKAAIDLMQERVPSLLGPAPTLVLAMAIHRAGRKDDAIKSLAIAARLFDWRPGAVRGRDAWIFHALRREAEAAILPNLAAFLNGKYQPTDNNERLALLPACQFNNRPAAAAKLYSDVLAADPAIAEDLNSAFRYDAACIAALAGCGVGDGAALDKKERSRWRHQARQWLRADLDAWAKLIDSHELERQLPMRHEATRWLTRWQSDSDLAGLREPKELVELTRSEQTECLALWDEVTAMLHRAQAIEKK